MAKSKERYYGTGRRKKSVARVYLMPGKGEITINKRLIDDYVGLETLKKIINQPFAATKTEGYLTRDPRMKERKKYGLKSARRAPQFSKR